MQLDWNGTTLVKVMSRLLDWGNGESGQSFDGFEIRVC